MTAGVVGLVAAAVGVAAAIGLSGGMDAIAVVLLALAVVLAILAVAVARRFASGSVAPVHCPRCGGLLSGHAPYCTHCGATMPRRRDES